ncbi:hypothetical protein BAE44_0007845 [Dichanthelium oligosanthes]|uniref:Uncharacterized protein n=1 Tax=Dichanthelium oligosanthes TaxID=888268 RepID=A0A1E5W157_9POAL|nr:hypothetical protein BAE44_0007845 [Dichanthelium oligosanthes]
MASLGQLVLAAGLAFLVLAAQDHVKHGSEEAAAGLFMTAACIPPPPEENSPPVQPLPARQRPRIPPSGPSDRCNDEVNRQKPSWGRTASRRLVIEAP